MIIPMVCFSCGMPIAHMWFDYLDLVKKYEIEQTNPPMVSSGTTSDHKHTPEYLALRDLKIPRMCCRRMFLSQHDMYEHVR
jgi:DNA-directed RNA polymerase subunit N (RpoN/RPB10)